MKVFLLSTYGEDGSEDMVGTLDPIELKGLIETNFPQYLIEGNPTLQDILLKIDQILTYDAYTPGQPYNLEKAWGGLQLHIVDL